MPVARATLWVLRVNERSRRFHELAGWRLDGEAKAEPFMGADLDQVRYALPLAG